MSSPDHPDPSVNERNAALDTPATLHLLVIDDVPLTAQLIQSIAAPLGGPPCPQWPDGTRGVTPNGTKRYAKQLPDPHALPRMPSWEPWVWPTTQEHHMGIPWSARYHRRRLIAPDRAPADTLLSSS